jgi:O-antigen/teichoic acid export membrane protein
MARRLTWRPQFGNWRQLLRPIVRYSAVNYVGSILFMLPTVVVPIIVLNRIGASAAAYYYVAFQLANLLFTAVYSVEQAFLVEGSHTGALSRPVLMRSARVLLALCVPAFLVVLLFGHELLLAFGTKYGANAETSLVALTTAVLPIAAQNWFLTILRLSNQLKAIVSTNGLYAVTITGLAWVLAPHGLGVMALAYPIGTSAATVVAGIAAVKTLRRNQPAEDRREERRPLAGQVR